MRPLLLLIACALSVQGCESLSGLSGTRDLPEEYFQEAWTSYQRCLASRDAREAEHQARRLSRAAFAREGEGVALPDAMASMIEPLPVRLAVEPKAMAAACALHAGHLAMEAGQAEPAYRLYSLVLRRFQEPAYLFYVAEARAGLLLVERVVSDSRAIPVGLR